MGKKENPYEDYIDSINIIMEIDFPEHQINKDNLDKLSKKLMNESEVQNLVASISSNTEKIFHISQKFV